MQGGGYDQGFHEIRQISCEIRRISHHEIRRISCEIERPLARNCNPMFIVLEVRFFEPITKLRCLPTTTARAQLCQSGLGCWSDIQIVCVEFYCPENETLTFRINTLINIGRPTFCHLALETTNKRLWTIF